jgi:hypothetical protein
MSDSTVERFERRRKGATGRSAIVRISVVIIGSLTRRVELG